MAVTRNPALGADEIVAKYEWRFGCQGSESFFSFREVGGPALFSVG
jgi:hypothetical protein